MYDSAKQRGHEDQRWDWLASRLKLCVVCCCLFSSVVYSYVSAAEIDETKLPPPAATQIDFTRDIKPILEASCLRCHGPEKPKGHFRLDNREAALKPDESGPNIFPGDSAKSPLIHYVAQLVEDMEMPPSGKGEPLTPTQIGILRAWIDQGLPWDETAPTSQLAFATSPMIGGTIVNGNKRKFQEHYWQPDGLNGVLQELDMLERTSPDTKITLSGRALVNDYKIGVAVDKNEFGFVHFGWEQYRKYYDDTGGYFPTLSSTTPSLGRDLFLDIGKTWIDFGLTPPDWPRVGLGYEYDYKRGEKSTTDWNAFGAGTLRNITPASKTIEEDVHILKLDIDHEIRGVTIEEKFRGEFYNLHTASTNRNARNPMSENISETYNHFQGANTLRLEKKFTDRLLGSAGYLYSKLNADATFQDDMTYNAQVFLNRMPQITLERESHVVNLNSLLGPFYGLTLSGGVQSEWTRQKGFGSGNLNLFNFPVNPPSTLTITNTTLTSDYDENSVMESLALRYRTIPFTVLFAEARLEQKSIGQSDHELQPGGNFLENVGFSSRLLDLRGGFNTSPWRSISLSAHYRRYENDSDYKNTQPPQPGGGYPGFFGSRDLQTDEIEAKLILNPARWLKATLSYQYLMTDYWTDTNPAFSIAPPGNFSPGGKILAGEYDSRIYSLGLTLTPWRRLYLVTTCSYQTSTSTTANNNTPAAAPYRGDIYSATVNGNYVLNETTDLFASYSFSQADFSQNNFAAGLPVGIKYQQHAAQLGLARRIGKNVTTRLQYGFYHYNEPSSGRFNDYSAHSVFGMITIRLP